MNYRRTLLSGFLFTDGFIFLVPALCVVTKYTQMTSYKKRTIHPPNLPKKLAAVSLTALESHDEYTESKLAACSLLEVSAKNVLFEESLLQRIMLPGARLPKIMLRDVCLEGCDLSVAFLEKSHLRRVEIFDSRLIGMQMISAEMDDLLFKDCNLEGAVFASAKGKHLHFENCQLQNASFEGAELENIRFSHCDLRNADFHNVKLAHADLRGSSIDGIQIAPEAVRGMTISSSQALQMVGLLGVIVNDDEDFAQH